jgi:hypothetical protein
MERIMGNELKRDTCPEKLYASGNLFVETLPALLALFFVGCFSGSLFLSAGVGMPLTILFEAIFVGGMYAFLYFTMKSSKKILSMTYLSICENGVSGVVGKNSFSTRSFQFPYEQIKQATVKGDRLMLKTTIENIFIPLKDATASADLIRSKLS